MWTLKHSLALFALALCCMTVSEASAATLSGVRFGSHKGYDRVVCEFSDVTPYSVIKKADNRIELRLRNVDVDTAFFLPRLPDQLKLIKEVEAFREGESDIVLEVTATGPITATPTELPGHNWRLAMDFSIYDPNAAPVTPPDAKSGHTSPAQDNAKSQPADHPEYIPGDKPFETKYADAKHEQAKEPTPVKDSTNTATPLEHPEVAAEHSQKDEQPETASHEENADQLETTENSHEELAYDTDTAKALEVLAEFFDLMGDEEAARSYARLYLDRTGNGGLAENDQDQQKATAPFWLITLIAFGAGLIGGVTAKFIKLPAFKLRGFKFRLPKFSLPRRNPKSQEESEPDEISRDIDRLDEAVANEKPRKPKPNDKPNEARQEEPKEAPKEVPKEVAKQAEEEFPADEEPANVEVAMKESLMDRRVKRVLELAADKRSLPEIAQELDMGQDEVKLILDLNS